MRSPVDRFIADLDPVTYFENDPAVQGTLAHLAAEMNLTKPQRILLLGNPDDPTAPPVRDLFEPQRLRGECADLTWMDEMSYDAEEDPMRDIREEAEKAAKAAHAEREAFDRHAKTEQTLASMNRADRRRWLRENRPR